MTGGHRRSGMIACACREPCSHLLNTGRPRDGSELASDKGAQYTALRFTQRLVDADDSGHAAVARSG
jgi:hypothetical protein